MKLATQLLLTCSFFLLSITKVLALDVPRLTGPVVDQANLLSAKEHSLLSGYIREYKKASGNQLQVLIIKSLEGDNLERFSIAVTDKWQLGGKEQDNGALFLISVQDRLTRIEVGQGLEGSLTDFKTRKILNSLKPYFRNSEFASGVYFVLSEMTKAIDGQPFQIQGASAKYKPHKKKKRSLVLFFLQFFLFGGFIFISRFSRYGRHSYYSAGGFGGGFSSGGGFSGGGWSGGGGGFSGGGSSGSW